VGERGHPSEEKLLSMRQINFKQENFQKIKNYISQGNAFISPMQKSMTSAFTIGLMESNKQRDREATSLGVLAMQKYQELAQKMRPS
jgi:hypothetical protein